MKKLFLIRHAKSSWEDHLLSDFERPLSDRGKKDAPTIGDILKSKKIVPELVISSPARRAIKTAKIFCEILGYPIDDIIQHKSIYEATTRDLMNIISGIDDKVNTVLMFGHNPGFTVLANLLSDKYIDNMPTSSVAGFELNLNSWKDIGVGCGNLILFEYLKKY